MNLKIPDRSFGGYIFDCDGTLVDSMPLHFEAWKFGFERHEAPWTWSEDEFYATAGVPDRVTVEQLNLRYGARIDADLVHERKREWYLSNLDQLKPVEAVADFARSRHAEGGKISVASGSEFSVVEASLEHTGLLDLFEIIITPAHVERGKPAPDMFLLAAEKMGVPPQDCLVFEDGKAGIEAAEAAGMEHVYVPSREVREAVATSGR